MKRILLASTALLCLQGLALAQEEVPAPVNLVDWNGGYVAVHGNWSHGHPDFFAENSSPTEFDTDWYGGGVEIGYDWRVGPWVYGVVADLDYLGMDTAQRFAPAGPGKGNQYEYDLDWTATARARAGHLFEGDRLLIYATGGLAITAAEARSTYFDTGPQVSNSASEILHGVVYGGGVEYAFAPNWSLKAEYLRFDFDRLVVPSVTNGFTSSRFEIEPTFDQVRLGVAYRF